MGRVQLTAQHHLIERFFRVMEPQSWGRLEAADCASVAEARCSLHVPVHFIRPNAELMLQSAAGPDRRRLLVVPGADPLSSQIAWLLNSGCLAHHQSRPCELPVDEYG